MTRREEFDIQMKIINRAKKLKIFPSDDCPDQATFAIDISKASFAGKKLDIKNLASFDDENFIHDTAGICKSIIRSGSNAGEMSGLFSPRCGWIEDANV